MRKRLAIGAVAIALSAVGGAWYTSWWQRPNAEVQDWASNVHYGLRHPPQYIPPDDNAEPADTIEPLIVESGVPAPIAPTSLPELEAPPLYLTPGMTQAPRPDAASGKALRMSYPEEMAVLPWPLEPLARILEGTELSKLKLFEKLKDGDPTEEAEEKEVTPPAEPPLPLRVPDYHNQPGHCPYMGGRYPYPR